MFRKQIVASLLLLVAVVFAAPSAEGEDYRLKKNFKPQSYEIKFDIPEKVLTADETKIEDAVAKIVINKPELDAKDQELHFHVDKDKITIKKILFTHKTTKNAELPLDKLVYDNNTQIAKIPLPEAISEPFTLTFTYDLTVATGGDMFGLYKSKYNVGDQEEYLLATQFESVYARRVFPCFDEPSFKATFKLAVSTKAAGYQVLTNTELVTDPNNVLVSPKMSTYLVEIIVSKFTATKGSPGADQTAHKVWSRDEVSSDRVLAASVGRKVLDLLGEKLKITFSESGLKKMDQIAIPDFDAGAMENWGLVTFRENALLFDKDESSTAAKMRVFGVIAHEFTHQWFGDLVTLDWWDVTFLNEGFANFFQYLITNELYTDYQMDKQFVVNVLQSALEADSVPSGKALESKCNSKAEIQAKFDDISYNKGASIINMVKHYIGESTLLTGLNKYLNKNKFGNVRPEHLWSAMDTSDRNLTTIMHDWINAPGFPLIHVSVKDKKITLSQKKFTLDGKDVASSWKVPIIYKTDKKTEETTILFEDKTEDIPMEKWIHLVNAKGFYRVNYDEELWKALIAAIKEKDASITDIDQAQIVDDLFTLGRINKLDYSVVFDHIQFLNQSDNYFVWVPAFKGFDFLLKRFGDNTELGKNILATVSGSMASVKKYVEGTNDAVEKLKMEKIYTWLCRTNDNKTLADAKTQFSNFVKDNTKKVNVDLRSAVYCYGQDGDDDWDKLFAIYTKTKSAAEKDVILKSLACTNNKDKINNLLQKSLENKEIRAQDGRTVFQAVLSHDVESALTFFEKHHEDIAKIYSGISLSDLVTSLADRLTDQKQINRLEDLRKNGNFDEQFKVVLESAIDVANANLKWAKKANEQLRKFYGLTDGATAIHLSISCIFALTLALIYNLF